MKKMCILAIESSCDESACAIVENGKKVLASVVASQIDVHKEFGGVIPEVASRIHIENISIVIEKALKEANLVMEDIDAVGFTQGPGLIGCLHVGVLAAKTLAWAFGKPLIPVHHIAGHIYANEMVCDLTFPLLALVVSGGHTELVYMPQDETFEVLGVSQDDAVGEAGDKVGRLLDLPYPGGVYLDQLAKSGKAIYAFKEPRCEKELDFSFSGLKSGVLQFIERCKRESKTFNKADLAASYQECAFQALLARAKIALENFPVKQMVLAGGVAANSRLREKIQQELQPTFPQTRFILPPLACCTDNATMIAIAAYHAFLHGKTASFSCGAKASMPME